MKTLYNLVVCYTDKYNYKQPDFTSHGANGSRPYEHVFPLFPLKRENVLKLNLFAAFFFFGISSLEKTGCRFFKDFVGRRGYGDNT